MPTTIYLTAEEVIRINEQVLRQAGQVALPARDQGLLESALQRPQQASFHEGADVVTQGALYMVGIAMNHPHESSVRRRQQAHGYVAGLTFLRLNGYQLARPDPADPQLAVWLEQVVTHTLAFENFVERLRKRLNG
jgi:death-on-curing protein